MKPALRSIQARNDLVMQNYSLAFWCVQRVWHLASVQRLGREDAEAAAVDGLLRAADLWDETKGWKFTTYASRAIYSRIFDAASKRYRKVLRDGRLQRHHTEEFAEDGMAGTVMQRYGFDIAYEDDRDTEGRLDLAAALRKIPDREYAVLMRRYQDGLTLAEVAETLGISKQRVSQVQQAGLERLRQIMTKGVTT